MNNAQTHSALPFLDHGLQDVGRAGLCFGYGGSIYLLRFVRARHAASTPAPAATSSTVPGSGIGTTHAEHGFGACAAATTGRSPSIATTRHVKRSRTVTRFSGLAFSDTPSRFARRMQFSSRNDVQNC